MEISPEVQIRYVLEQRLIPQMLFSEHGANTVNTILKESGSFFVTCLRYLAEDEGIECKYKDSDFKIQPMPLYDNNENLVFAVIIIDMPEPSHITLCSRLFICHDGQFENVHYYMIEKSSGTNMLCERDENDTHHNYGPAPDGLKEQFKTVVRLCWN